jgi:enoyl-CoA hydratase/carnithine racemase
MDLVHVVTDGPLLLIKLNRPGKLNALTPQMYHVIGKALWRLNRDAQLRVAVLHAEGPHFTAGLELDLWADAFASGTPFAGADDEIDLFGLTGDRWSAEEAQRWGMVQELVEPGAQLAKALECARAVAAAAPLGVQGCLKATRMGLGADHDAAVGQMFGDLVPVMKSADAAEGVRSFLERRPANFTGR